MIRERSMIRLTGALALIIASVTSVVLFAQVRTLRFSGKVSKDGGRAPVELVVSQQDSCLFEPSDLPALPAAIAVVTTGQVVLGVFGTEGLAHDLPANAQYDVDVTHRWLNVKGLMKPFGYLEIRYQERRYDSGRSMRSFFGTLGMVSAAPILVWVLFAFPFALRSKKGDSMPNAPDSSSSAQAGR
jgi:hypothetical protein